MTEAHYSQEVIIPIPVPAIPVTIEYERRLQGTAQQCLAAGHGYIAVYHVDPNFVRAFLATTKCDVYLTEYKIPVRIHLSRVDKEAATGSARLECPHNGFHLMVLLDTRGP
eukprot:8259232-Heterocapsa_arctica.AAC.1